MGRLVELDGTGPRKLDESDVDPEKGDVAICRCGLSEDFPFCDGTHRATSTEDPAATYRYDRQDDGLVREQVDAIETVDDSREHVTERDD
jgi:CDGSH-type Zn-finger protein